MALVYVHIMTKKVGIVKCEILEGSVGDACCRLGWQEMVVDGCLGVLVFVCVCVCVCGAYEVVCDDFVDG